MHYDYRLFYSSVPVILVHFDAFSVGQSDFIALLFRDMDPTQASGDAGISLAFSLHVSHVCIHDCRRGIWSKHAMFARLGYSVESCF